MDDEIMIKIKKKTMLDKKFSGADRNCGREFLVRSGTLINSYESLCRDQFLAGNHRRFRGLSKQEIIDTYSDSYGFEFVHFDTHKELFLWLSSCKIATKQQVIGFENLNGERGFVKQKSIRDDNVWILKLAKEINTEKEEFRRHDKLRNVMIDQTILGAGCIFRTFYNINDLFKWTSEGRE